VKKVLIITTHFPPDRHVGGHRPVKFAKYFPKFGWQPVILTVPINEIRDGVDHSLLTDLPKNFRIYRVPGWGISGQTISTIQQGGIRLISRIRSIIGVFLLRNYNVKWIINGYKVGTKIMRHEKVDLIYATVPDPEAYIIALLLSVLSGKKFVCDFRDPTPWMFEKRVSFENIIMKFLQKVMQWKANAIVSISNRLTIRLIENGWLTDRNKYLTIYNGFDIDDFKGINCIDSNKIFTISFIGSLGRQRDPKYFLEAFELLLQEKPELIKKIKLLFIGWIKRDVKMEKWFKERLSKGLLKNTVEFKGFLPYKLALSEMCQADVLLTFNSEDIVNNGSLESKFFEYLYSNKTILALTPQNCDMARLIRDLNAGIVVPPDSPDLIANAILKLYQDYCNNSQRGATQDDVKQFERKQLTKRLAELFDAVMIGKRKLSNIVR